MIRAKHSVKKNDLVMVVAGKEKGKSGRILRVINKKDRAIVERINLIKRHQRPTGQQRQGGIIEREGTIHLSNLMVICEKCNKPIQVGRRFLDGGKKARYCKKCGELIDK